MVENVTREGNKEVSEKEDVEEEETEGNDEGGDDGKGEEDEEEAQGSSDDEEEAEEGEDEEGKKDDEDIRGKGIQLNQDSSDDEDDSGAVQPERLYFFPTDYTKMCRIGTRCRVRQTVEYLEKFSPELKWFRAHGQFKHVFHMPKEQNHMTQGMWMLLVRTTRTDVQGEHWFLVNGRLIRYSIREHALLTGFNCKEYPANWKKLGSLDMVNRVFKKSDGIKVKDVEKKLAEMKDKSSTDRKKLAVLYFLCNVLKAKSKHDGKIDSFLLSIVDDLSACETFPWGRYTFYDCIAGIEGLLKNMKGVVPEKAQTQFSGFIIPLEILAFECIPVLGGKFREDVRCDPGCPRMCKQKFVAGGGGNKGFPLEEIYKALGDTKDIISILQPTEDERSMLRRNVEDGVYNDLNDTLGFIDPVVESWRERLLVQKKKIFLKGWHEMDVGTRGASSSRTSEAAGEKENPVEHPENPESIKEVVLKELEKGFAILMEALGKVDIKVVERLDDLDMRVKSIQKYVADKGKGVVESEEEDAAKDAVENVEEAAEEDEGEKKKKAEKKKDGEAEEKKRHKLEKMKKTLGDVDVITTGKKRKRNNNKE